MSDWIETYSGVKFNIENPCIEDIRLEDIAHSLSLICRFNGNIKYHYSVGQHCLNVCSELAVRGYDHYVQLIGLLHDASESYICDIPRPLKNLLPEYKILEKSIQDNIYKKLIGRLPTDEELAIVEVVDDDYLYVEALALLNKHDWVKKNPSVVNKIYAQSSSRTEQSFGVMYRELVEFIQAFGV